MVLDYSENPFSADFTLQNMSLSAVLNQGALVVSKRLTEYSGIIFFNTDSNEHIIPEGLQLMMRLN